MTTNRHTARVADLVLPFPGGDRRPPPRRSGPVIGGASGTEHGDGVVDSVHRARATISPATSTTLSPSDKGQLKLAVPGQ